MITIKSDSEIEIMAAGGKITADVLKSLFTDVKEGNTPLQLENKAVALITKYSAEPSFKMVEGYHWATCICVNDVVVHGIPSQTPFVKGDIVGIDLGVYYKGFHTDSSWTVCVGAPDEKKKTFLLTGKRALFNAIEKVRLNGRVGQISESIEKTVKQKGFSPVRALVGHGIGRELHEDPQIPCFLRGKIENTPFIKEGMVFAIEVIYNMGSHKVFYKNDDGWTIASQDGLPSGLFEATVAVTGGSFRVLTEIE